MATIFLFLVSACASKDDSPALPDAPEIHFPQILKSKTFQVETPLGWELSEEQSTDTYIGRIKNDSITVLFNQIFLLLVR